MQVISKIIVKNFYSFLLIVLLFVAIYLLSRLVPEESISLFLDRAGFWAPLVFVLLVLITYIIAPFSASPLIFAGFYAFGTNVVFFFSIAAFIASISNFWIARRWGKSMVVKLVGQENMEKIDKLTKDYGLVALFVLRIFQGGIHDFVSYAAGLTSLRFSSYLLVSTMAMIPGTIIWYFLSLRVTTPAAFTILTLALVVAFSTIFILGSLILGRWRKRKE